MKNTFKALLFTILVASCGDGGTTETSIVSTTRSGTDRVNFRAVSPTCQNPKTRLPATRCTFYRECLEASITCEDTNFPYAISYGEKYCNKFTNMRPAMSPKGQGWIDGTMLCLQEGLALWNGQMTSSLLWGQPSFPPGSDPHLPIYGSCQDVREGEFAIHPICYLGGPARFSGTKHDSVCSLNISDTKNVFLTVDASDVMTAEAAVQMVSVARQCIAAYKSKLGGVFGLTTRMFGLNMLSDENQQLLDLWQEKEKEWTAKATNNGALPKNAEKIPAGFFLAKGIDGIYWSNGDTAYCRAASPEFVSGRVKVYDFNILNATDMFNTGTCDVTIPEGSFSVPGIDGIHWSNGTTAYCRVAAPEFVVPPVKVYGFDIYSASKMHNTGTCNVTIPAGFFNVRDMPGIYMSNGVNAYCYVPAPKYVTGPVHEYTADVYSLSNMQKQGACAGMD